MNLTSREQQVLELLSQGEFNKEIADKLGISEQTVKNHITNLFGKLGASNKAHAVLLAIERGLLETATNGCDFQCGKVDEPVIALVNIASGHKWRCHLSCLKKHIKVQETINAKERSL